MSTKMALDQLGFGPCHHMTEVMGNPAQLPYWKSIFAGEQVDFAQVYAGYTSQVDWPGAYVAHRAWTAFPDAKVIHTERPEDEWGASFSTTIGKFFAVSDQLTLPPYFAEVFGVMKSGFLKETFDDCTDRDNAIAAYRRNNRQVREMFPADRLLVFAPAGGWEPLCRFLDVPIPATPFPRSNAPDDFWSHFGGEPEVTAA